MVLRKHMVIEKHEKNFLQISYEFITAVKVRGKREVFLILKTGYDSSTYVHNKHAMHHKADR